ncbi:MAG: non-heme iron oxygenase ferredoxin subunit [Chloroflexota bacterium]
MQVSQWIKVAQAAEIAPGEGKQIEVNGEELAIWNVDGEYYTTSDVCTHEETSLSEGDLWGEVVECPLHGAQFDVRTGEVLSLPAIFPIATYPTKVENGEVYIEWTK